MALTDIPTQAAFQQQLNIWAQARDENGDRYMSGGDIRNVYADENGNNQVSGRTWAEILADGNNYLFNSGTTPPIDPLTYAPYAFTSAGGGGIPAPGEAYNRNTQNNLRVNRTDANGETVDLDAITVGSTIWFDGVLFWTVSAVDSRTNEVRFVHGNASSPPDGTYNIGFGIA